MRARTLHNFDPPMAPDHVSVRSDFLAIGAAYRGWDGGARMPEPQFVCGQKGWNIWYRQADYASSNSPPNSLMPAIEQC